MICSMLQNLIFHNSFASTLTLLPVSVEWNEEPSGDHRRHTRREASERCRFPRHLGFRKDPQDAGTSKNVGSNGRIGKYTSSWVKKTLDFIERRSAKIGKSSSGRFQKQGNHRADFEESASGSRFFYGNIALA